MTFFKQLLFIGLFLGIYSFGQAQRGNYPMLRERIMNAKFEFVKSKLLLTDQQSERFRPIYLNYEKEMGQLGKIKDLRFNNVNADSLSAEAADKLITDRLDYVQKQLDLRKKYHAEFKKVLSPQQIIKLYQAETEIRQKILLELRNRREKRMQ